MISLNKLNSVWERIGIWDRDAAERGGAGFPERPEIQAYERETLPERWVNGYTWFNRNAAGWERLFRLLKKLPEEMSVQSVLVTAMSVGADVRDGARIADEMGVYEHHPDLKFYGHDLSPLFTEAARTGYVPKIFTMHLQGRGRYFEDCEGSLREYARVRPVIEERIAILKPGNILDLQGQFDVVVSNTMNPPPRGLSEALNARARHLTLTGGAFDSLYGMSPEWKPYCRQNGIGWGRGYVETLTGEKTPRDIPEALILAKSL